MGIAEKCAYYLSQYGVQIALSIPYFALASFVGLFLVLRRASLFGLVLSASAQLAFIIGMALHLVSHESTQALVLMQNADALVADLLHMDLYLFPLLALIVLPLVVFMSRGMLNTESVLAILFIFLLGLVPLVNKLAGGSDLLLLKAYFTEILYTPKKVFIHYLLHLGTLTIALVFLYRKIFITGFDPVQAQLLGVKVEAVNILFYVCAGFIIALCVRMLGIYVAMMVLISPAVIALIAFRTMKMVIIGTIAFSVLFALSGFALSFTFDSLPAEPTIIVVFGFASFGVWGGKKIFSLFRRA